MEMQQTHDARQEALQRVQQDALFVAVEAHAIAEEMLLQALSDKPEVLAIYEERVKPAWGDFLAEFINRGTSLAAGAANAVHDINEEARRAIWARLTKDEHRLDVHDAQLKDHEDRIRELEKGDGALADDR